MNRRSSLPTIDGARDDPATVVDTGELRVFRLLASIVTAVMWCASHAQATTSHPSIVIDGVTVVDVAHGTNVGPRTVLIVEGRIAAIAAPGAVEVPAGATHVDGQGRYLIPGLVDLHVHLFNNASHRPPNTWAFPLFVANGVTGVREMYTEPAEFELIDAWRRAVASGELIAPRVLAAGVPVHGAPADALRQQVRDAHRAGADFIKVFSELSEPGWRVVLAEARAEHLPVSGHVPATVDAITAANAGQITAEHLMQVYEACSKAGERLTRARDASGGASAVDARDAQEAEVLAGFDARLCDRVARALARSGQAQVPTLVLPFHEANADAAYHDDPRWVSLRPDEQQRWDRNLGARSAADGALAAERWIVSKRIVHALLAAGVPVLAGTDTPMPLVYPGYSLHEELELLVGSGMSPAAALRAATLAAAELLGQSGDSGSIEAGKRADLVLLDADPLVSIENTRRIDAVVLAGRLLRREDLDALLAAPHEP